MISYHFDSIAILVFPFKSRKDSHRLLSYNEITTRLLKKNQLVELQILDNEASVEYLELNKYGIRIKVVWNHELLIATAITNWESPTIVRVKFSDVICVDVELLIRFAWLSYRLQGGVTMN